MARSITIPPEIIYAILNQLQDDRPTLQTTSLVARSFLYPSQSLLFSKVFISFPPEAWPSDQDSIRRTQRLLSVFEANKELALHTRELAVFVQSFQGSPTSDVLTQILAFLRHLRKASLRFFMQWNFQDPGIQQSIINLCRLESLTDIGLNGIKGFPFDLLLPYLPQLRRLTLERVELLSTDEDEVPFSGHGSDLTTVTAEKGRLEVLEFDTNTSENGIIPTIVAVLKSPHSQLGIKNLRVLKANGGGPAITRAIQETLNVSANTLECFIWAMLRGDFRYEIYDRESFSFF